MRSTFSLLFPAGSKNDFSWPLKKIIIRQTLSVDEGENKVAVRSEIENR